MLTQKDIREDKEANLFARAILMPKPLLIPEFKKHKETLSKDDLIKHLSKVFSVPQVDMVIRLKELKLI